MIKLKKIEKPAVLKDNEKEWESLYLAYLNGDDSIPKSVKNKYSHQEIKNALIKETNGKCAYCESKLLHISFGDIEHILPKSVLPEKTFEWENLTLACTICNNKKRDYYDKNNRLIDPYKDNPEDCFFFAGPLLIGKNDNANITKLRLDLNRPELIEDRVRKLQSLEGFVMHIQNTRDEDLREALLTDLNEKAFPSEEYSKMIKDFINEIENKLEINKIS